MRKPVTGRLRAVACTLACVACLVGTGCSAADEPAPRPASHSLGVTSSSGAAEPHAGPARSRGPVTLRLAVYGAPAQLRAYRELARAFHARHPRVTVDLVTSPDPRAATRRVRRATTRGTAPDVFVVPHTAVPGLVASGQVHPVDRLLEQRGLSFGDDYQRVGLEAFSAHSALQCMPHDVSPLVVYYNRELVDPSRVGGTRPGTPVARAGWTWRQFVAAAHAAARGPAKGVYVEPSLRTLVPLVRSAGGDLLDDDRAPSTLTLEGARGALARVVALTGDRAVSLTPAQLRRQDAVTRFQRGRLGMLLATRDLTPRLRETPGLDFDVMPLPSLGSPRTWVAMSGYCVAAGTPHLQAAADLLAFAARGSGAAITARPGYVVPANLAVAHSPAFTQPRHRPESAFVFTEADRGADSPPFVRGWHRVETSTRPLLARLLQGRRAGRNALLRTIDERSRHILTRANRAPAGPAPTGRTSAS